MENLYVWIYVYLVLSVTISLAQVTEHHSKITLGSDGASLGPKKSTMNMLREQREEHFDLNSSVTLACSNKTFSSILFATWKISIRNISCEIASGVAQENKDTCQDGKVGYNTSEGQIYLHIPHFTHQDVGNYQCYAVHKGGNHISEIKVFARAPLSCSTRLDVHHRVAVCSAKVAEGGASISWRTSWNSTGNQSSTRNPDGTYALESRVSLPEGAGETDLECIITHPAWSKNLTEMLHVPDTINKKPSRNPWLWIIPSVCSICFLTGILVGLCIIRKHLSKIRNCCKQSLSHPPPPHTTVKPQDVDELEPYASYVQRVNSIYNSSADLCNI